MNQERILQANWGEKLRNGILQKLVTANFNRKIDLWRTFKSIKRKRSRVCRSIKGVLSKISFTGNYCQNCIERTHDMSKFEIDAGNYDAHKLMQISEIVVKLKPMYFCTERLLKRCMILENICVIKSCMRHGWREMRLNSEYHQQIFEWAPSYSNRSWIHQWWHLMWKV